MISRKFKDLYDALEWVAGKMGVSVDNIDYRADDKPDADWLIISLETGRPVICDMWRKRVKFTVCEDEPHYCWRLAIWELPDDQYSLI